MASNIIFTINEIFESKAQEGALTQHNAVKYYIAPYQRGYKWASENENDSVCVLMKDLLDAFENNSNDYYLQFITTKVSHIKEQNVLEIIDGQQRLTTLTIILSITSIHLNENQIAKSNNLLAYEIRENVTSFFDKYIYDDIKYILSIDFENFTKQNPEYNEQDIYYLFKAANKINEILKTKLTSNDKVLAFEDYLLNNVKLILNNISRKINCEEMFSNLNDNKVDLTSTDLLKGLILTKTAREKTDLDKKSTYKELLEVRAIIGRQWDEIAHWVNRKDINIFYFRNSFNAFDDLLLMLAINDGFTLQSTITNKNDVFNYFQSQINKGFKTTTKYFEELKQLSQILNEWFNNTEIYNSLGFLLFAKRNEGVSINKYLKLLYKSKTAIKETLKYETTTYLPVTTSDLEYGTNNDIILNTLLALNVFGRNEKFDFTSFYDGNKTWSIEHIFPQKPAELPDNLEEKDLQLIKSLGRERLIEYDLVKDLFINHYYIFDTKRVFESIKSKIKLNSCQLTTEEKTLLYRLIRTEKLNNIGNMALLTKSDNSSNKNGMFDKKRVNIATRVSNGSFVPKHTYDVFSKLISASMTPDLTVWTEDDIDAHQNWIEKRIKLLKG